nr:reverse transcriptase domain-containing protein [Tanacetum cinerariifolium]
MLPIWEYLNLGIPDNPQKARKIRIKASLYRIIDGTLYRISYLSPWLRCAGVAQTKSIIQEVNQGSCGMHPEAMILVEISIETRRIYDFDPKKNKKRHREDLDILKEIRQIASIKEAHYKQKLEGYYNKHACPTTFKPAPHQDLSPFNQNFLQQPMKNPEDITDPTTAMNMALALMAKAFKLNYSTPTNNNQRISSNPRNRQIAQPGMNMGQDRQMQMIGGNGGNQFRQYAGQNVGNLNGYNDV